MTAPLRDDFDIPYHDIGPRDRTPRLALVAGIHGNEPNGVFVLSRLADFLNRIQTQRDQDQTLVERVLIVPAVNVLGINTRNRFWPFDKVNINRMFPGRTDGETTQRIAAAVMALTTQAYYRVDIHTSNLDIEEMPQVRLYEPNDDERATACLFGLPAVVERTSDTVLANTLNHGWREYGGENFVMQCGQAGSLQPAHCEVLFRALVAFLNRTGIVTGISLAEDEDDIHYFGLNQSFAVISAQAGIFVSRREVGAWIRAGDRIGNIYDGFSGAVRARVKAPVTGLLSTLRRQPLLCEGDLIARLMTSGDSGDSVDQMLHGHGQ
jgi:hypothetical protein